MSACDENPSGKCNISGVFNWMASGQAIRIDDWLSSTNCSNYFSKQSNLKKITRTREIKLVALKNDHVWVTNCHITLFNKHVGQNKTQCKGLSILWTVNYWYDICQFKWRDDTKSTELKQSKTKTRNWTKTKQKIPSLTSRFSSTFWRVLFCSLVLNIPVELNYRKWNIHMYL